MDNSKARISGPNGESGSPVTLASTPKAFLETLWGENPPGVANIFVLPDRQSLWFRTFSEVDKVLEGRELKEVYTGVALADGNRQSGREGGRVAQNEAAVIPGFWADIDVQHPVHKKQNLPPTLEDAKLVIAQLPFEPTLVVDSGHGLQYWWLFASPWIFADDAEREEASRLCEWWSGKIGESFHEKGWQVDSVFDLSRVMRLPGSWNNKEANDRKPVQVVGSSGPRIPLEVIRKAVPADFEPSSAKSAKSPSATKQGGKEVSNRKVAASVASDLKTEADARPGEERLEALLEGNEIFRATWERDRPDLNDQSASGYDLALAIQMARAGWPDQEIVDALIFWRASQGEGSKLRKDYYQSTIEKAKLAATKGRAGTEGRERVVVSQDELKNMENCVTAFLRKNAPPTVFSISEAGGVAVVADHEGKNRVEVCDVNRIRVELVRRMQFVKVKDKGEQPATMPANLKSDVYIVLRKRLPPLRGFVKIPTFWDGSLVAKSGYHPPSGYYFDLPEGLDLNLSVQEGLDILDEYFGQFPFLERADKANALSVILGGPLKALGNSPGLMVDKPVSQTGASLLCRCLALVLDDRQPALITQGKTNGELEKWVVTKLKSHPSAIIFDNLSDPLKSDMVVAGMTDESFGSRLLGLNEEILVPTRSLTLMFTGNNLSSNRDLINRCFRCRLDANHPAPENRTDFRHLLPDDLLENRVLLVSAISSIAQRWVERGLPEGRALLGSYIRYTKALSGLMEIAGIPGLDENRSKASVDLDPQGAILTLFIQEWWENHKGALMTASELVGFADALDLAGTDERSLATSLSGKLRRAMGRVFPLGDNSLVKLEEHGRDENGRAKRGIHYKLVQVE